MVPIKDKLKTFQRNHHNRRLASPHGTQQRPKELEVFGFTFWTWEPLAFERNSQTTRHRKQCGKKKCGTERHDLSCWTETRQLSHDPRGCRHIQSVTAPSENPISVCHNLHNVGNKLEYNNAELEFCTFVESARKKKIKATTRPNRWRTCSTASRPMLRLPSC